MSNMIYVPGEVLTVVVDNQPYVVQSSHPNFRACVEAAKEMRFGDIPDLVNIPKAITKFSNGKITVDEQAQVVMYGGEELHNYACDRLLGMMYEGFDIEPLVNFLENLMQNPSMRAVSELYKFLEHGKMPLTPDGHFLAYKRVREDYTSVHDGKTNNGIGMIVEMPRNTVDENSNRTCSYGLHFCSHEYLSSFSGDRVVILKVNPRDVVAIPADYNDTKGRACRYEVVGELAPDEVKRALGGESVWNDRSVVDDFDADDDDWFADDDADDMEVAEALAYANNEKDNKDFGLVEPAMQPVHAAWPFPGDFQDDKAAGYSAGYFDGRNKRPESADWPEVADFQAGYSEGYKDGRGHKAKKYK